MRRTDARNVADDVHQPLRVQACSFEAMLAGQQHLYDLGYLLEDSENDDREDAQQVRPLHANVPPPSLPCC